MADVGMLIREREFDSIEEINTFLQQVVDSRYAHRGIYERSRIHPAGTGSGDNV